MARKII